MRKALFSLLNCMAIAGALTLTSCEKNPATENTDTGGNTGNNPQKNTVTGVVKDAQGRPVAGAKVRIENDFSYYDVTTNSQGQYSCYVAAFGSYKALAWAPVSYGGNNYTMRVGMPNAADYDFFDPRNGAVRNFQLQHKGRIPDRTPSENGTGYFGASINFYKLGSIYGPNLETGDVVTYTLTPIGQLMDGTNGQVLQGTFNIQSSKSEYYVVDVPPGKYKAEAIVTRNGANYRVYVGGFASQNESVEIIPRPGDYGVGSYENGFMSPANVVYMAVR